MTALSQSLNYLNKISSAIRKIFCTKGQVMDPLGKGASDNKGKDSVPLEQTGKSRIDFREELERLRRRLLDLSLGNRLLNYKPPPASSIQIVDELPNLVFERLVINMKPFYFEPLKSEAHGDLPLDQNEDIEIELPKHPEVGEGIAARHRDNKLKTTAANEEILNRILKNIQGKAKRSIEETGINILFLALGMLEWRDSDSSKETYKAPLILIPVEITKTFSKKHGHYFYQIVHTGEEVQDNLSLSKKLEHDFGYRLPEFEDCCSPEEYFCIVSEKVARPKGWSVNREATVGFFSFRKMRMYEDLNPDNWPKDEFFGHELIKRLIEGDKNNVSSKCQYLTDYEIDDVSDAEKVILANDADSSQHSALMDIFDGKDMVIEGPPGTGKSQTITNAIAAALHQQKRVLFVSEKLAALKVVEKNLEKLGLKDFCLELHSEGAKPQTVYKSLQERLNKHFPSPQKLAQVRQSLSAEKSVLKEYLTAIKQISAPRNETIYQIIGRITHLRACGAHPDLHANIETDLTNISFNERLAIFDEIENYEKELGGDNLHNCCWCGFYCPDMDNENLIECKNILRQLADVSGLLTKQSTGLSELCSNPTQWIEYVVAHPEVQLNILSDMSPLVEQRWCAPLSTEEKLNLGRDCLGKISRFQEFHRKVCDNLMVSPDDAIADSTDSSPVLVQAKK